jgi:hypothetical protein
MLLDQINAACQAEREHLVKNTKTLPKAADSDHFMTPFIVLDKSLHKAGAELNKIELINKQ